MPLKAIEYSCQQSTMQAGGDSIIGLSMFIWQWLVLVVFLKTLLTVDYYLALFYIICMYAMIGYSRRNEQSNQVQIA